MLPPHLLRSKEIRFAVAVHEAVNTNNYIRFFRLARLATCLNACLMHRYFVQIRSQALLRLAASFAGHPKREVQYPVETLKRQLEFEDRREAHEFCESWGLSVIDDFVIFDKQMPPQPPELAWRERRAFRLIESKRAGTALSALFNNEPINPKDAQPLPVHSSFDANGRFIAQANESLDWKSEPIAPSENASNASQIFGAYHQEQPKFDSFPTRLSQPAPHFSFSPAGSTAVPQSNPVVHLSEREKALQMLSIQSAASSFVTEWIFEALELEPVARESLAAEYVARQIQSEIIDQTLRSALREVAKSTVDAVQTSRVRQLSDELFESILNETFEQEIVQIATTFLAYETVLNEIICLDLLPSLIHSVARSCLLIAEADAYSERTLLRHCFERMRAWMYHKAQEDHDRALLRSMPACPSTTWDALRLTGLQTASTRICALRRARSGHETGTAQNSAYPGRFSVWADAVDHQMTWSPLTPSNAFSSRIIGIYQPSCSAHSPSLTHRQFCGTVIPWLLLKLIRFNPIVIDEHNATLPKDLFAVLSLGNLSPSFAKQFSEQCVPVLLLQPSQWVEPLTDASKLFSLKCKRLTLPCRENGQFVPHLGWASVLQTGLDWLISTVTPQLSQSLHCDAGLRLNKITVSQIPSLRLRPTELIRHVIGLRFIRPMTILSRDWSSRGLVDPSLQSLVDAYQSVLTNILDRIHEVPVRDQIERLLDLRTVFFSLSHMASVRTQGNAWIPVMGEWRVCAEKLALSAERIETVELAFQQAQRTFEYRIRQSILHGDRLEILPHPTLAPWFRMFMVVVRDRLDKLVNSNVMLVPGLETLQALVDELSKLELCENDQYEGSTLASLAVHFSQSGQPAASVAMAVELSLDALRKEQITTALNSSAHESSAASDLEMKLNMLAHRLDDVESLVSQTLQETETHSLTWKRTQSLSRIRSSKRE
ncbi:unnamed protein product [Echinostoma caproni]|uniref:SAC3_GANP domain-containing protein n=1 Tax=Echinostoma caproni TaxID=27848 RepID=A0A183A9S9_9TREM|nr:unnamed protein product [Echinostoma caproni]